MTITIKKEYFDNIETAIKSLNNFFGSDYKTKDFPMIESNEQLDATILSILSWMNNVDPTWIDNSDKIESAIERINRFAEERDEEDGADVLTQLTNDNNTSALDLINSFIGYKMLQMISDHFETFNELMNGIFTFELFTKTSKYSTAINTFSKPVSLDEIIDVTGDNQYQIFNEEKYVHGIFDNSQIKLPKELKLESELKRFTEHQNLDNIEINVDTSVQEAADINYFVDMHPENLRYHPGLKVVQISKQFEAKVNQLVSGLRGCNTTDDLKNYFASFPFSPDDFTSVVIPCILARVFDNPRKFPNQDFDKAALKKYTDSYKSILGKNDGAKRFGSYDIFSTFKSDKEGTIKFIEDFLKLRLVNDESGMISNNTLLTTFNIFDSRIYLDIMYNMLPPNVRESKAPSEDAFVKKVRAKINKNSRNGNIYKKETPIPEDNSLQTSDQVQEYVSKVFLDSKDLSISDLMYCEHYHDMVQHEINTLGDTLYNHGVSPEELLEYIGESFDIFQEANSTSKKARKNSQEFMRKEYGNSHPTTMSSKQRNRMKKFLKENDYDPKTETIRTDIKTRDNKPVRVKLDTKYSLTGSTTSMPFSLSKKQVNEEIDKLIRAGFSRKEAIERVSDEYDGMTIDYDHINMPKTVMKQHPSISTGILKHEEGHIAKRSYGDNTKALERSAEKVINKADKKDIVTFNHMNPEEFAVDVYAARHNKYKDKVRFLRSGLNTKNALYRKEEKMTAKKQFKDTMESLNIESLDDILQFINNSTESLKTMIEYVNDSKYSGYTTEKEAEDGIKKLKDSINAWNKIKSDIEKNRDYLRAKGQLTDLMKSNIQKALKDGERLLDNETDLRIEFVKRYVKEYAIENNISIYDSICQFYQEAFEEYVFSDDEDEEDIVQEGLFSAIGDHFTNKKLKKIAEFEQELNVKFSQEYIDILCGKVKLHAYDSNDFAMYVIYKKFNKSMKNYVKTSMVDIPKYKTDKSIDQTKLFKIGHLLFSQNLPKKNYAPIICDTDGNVYSTCDQDDAMKLVKVSSSIVEFVRYIAQRPFPVRTQEYTIYNAYTLNGRKYSVDVKLDAKKLYPIGLCFETAFIDNHSFEWTLEDLVYPAIDKYLNQNNKDTYEKHYDAYGNQVYVDTSIKSDKMFNCIRRVIKLGSYDAAVIEYEFAFIFDPKQNPVITVQTTNEDVTKVTASSDLASIGNMYHKSSSNIQTMSGLKTLGVSKSIKRRLMDEIPSKIDEEDQSYQEGYEDYKPIDGSIPDYMKTRIKLSDGDEDENGNNTPRTPTIDNVQLPPDIPSNSYSDLTDSINARLDSGDGNLDTKLGSGYTGEISKYGGEGKVVYNIHYNYNNSYNTNSGNTNTTTNTTTNTKNSNNTTTNDNSGNTTNTTDSSIRHKTINTNSYNTTTNDTENAHKNNNNNSTVLSDTDNSKNKFTNGKSIQEVFAILEFEEPLSNKTNAGDMPKQDMLTNAMDNDRKSLSKQQNMKKGLQKIGNTGRAIAKPVTRAKTWLTGMVNSLIKRDEDEIKASMIQNPSYRSAIFKASRIALKLGMTGAFLYINPYLGLMYAGAQGLKLADRNRLQKEVIDEFATELKILDEKIELTKREISYGTDQEASKKKLYELMRTRDKMQRMAPQSMKSYIKSASGLY